jgi:hypothetical protein
MNGACPAGSRCCFLLTGSRGAIITHAIAAVIVTSQKRDRFSGLISDMSGIEGVFEVRVKKLTSVTVMDKALKVIAAKLATVDCLTNSRRTICW